METNQTRTTKSNKGPGVRSPALLAICKRADSAVSAAYGSYDQKDFKAAADCCLQAALRANKDGLNDWANEYGRQHREMNVKALGG